MTRVLIPTFPEDLHATEAALALADPGIGLCSGTAPNFPTCQTATVRFDADGESRGARGKGLDLAAGKPPFEVIWFRHPIEIEHPPLAVATAFGVTSNMALCSVAEG